MALGPIPYFDEGSSYSIPRSYVLLELSSVVALSGRNK